MKIKITIIAALATFFGSLGMDALFDGSGWAWSAAGAVIVVAGTGVLTRRLRLPATLSAAAGSLALLLYLTLRYTSEQAFAGFVPTPGSLDRMAQLIEQGQATAQRYAAPVPLGDGVSLLAVIGIGVAAVAVDLLAVRLGRVAAAGLPLLAIYSVPAALQEDSVSWPAFALGALGYLALLVTDSRAQVGRWGRPVAGAAVHPAAADSAVLAGTGRRLAVTAVVAAVAVPALMPGIQPRTLFQGAADTGAGSQTVTTPDPLVSLKRELTRPDDAEVLRYRTDDPRPDYLRLYALDQFDGDRWTYRVLKSTERDRVAGRTLPPPTGLIGAPPRTVTTRVQVSDRVRDMTFLPAPYAPTRVSARGDWRVHPESLMIYSPRDAADGGRYTVRSLRSEPTAEQLAAGGSYPPQFARLYISLPDRFPRQVHDRADQITKGARTAYGQAMRLQRWFTTTGGFSYDLSVPPPRHTSDLIDFLEYSKSGYCEQYAAAMALMARSLGIPARVAMGYTAGTVQPNGEWVVRSKDAHAWPELYFPGAGWVRFEPTPAGGAGQGTASVPPYTLPADRAGGDQEPGSQAPAPGEPADPGAAPGGAAERRMRDLDQPADSSAAPRPDKGMPAGVPAALLLVMLLLATPVTLRALSRRRAVRLIAGSAGGASGAAPDESVRAAHAAWRELRADAVDHGLVLRPSDSPRATARRLTEELELATAAAAALHRLATAEELARYSTRAPVARSRLDGDVRTVRQAFAAAVGRRIRLRAKVAPPSTMRSVGSASTRGMEAAQRISARRHALTSDVRRRLNLGRR